MSFTDYYYNYGFGSFMEKVAKKKKEDGGMSLGAKLGLGAAGLGAAGLGAYFGGDALGSLSDTVADYAPSIASKLQGVQGFGADAAKSVGDYVAQNAAGATRGLHQAGDWANENVRDKLYAMVTGGSRPFDFGEAATNLKRDARDIFIPGAKDAVRGAVDNVTGEGKQLLLNAKGMGLGGALGTRMSSAADPVKDAIGGAANKLKVMTAQTPLGQTLGGIAQEAYNAPAMQATKDVETQKVLNEIMRSLRGNQLQSK